MPERHKIELTIDKGGKRKKITLKNSLKVHLTPGTQAKLDKLRNEYHKSLSQIEVN